MPTFPTRVQMLEDMLETVKSSNAELLAALAGLLTDTDASRVNDTCKWCGRDIGTGQELCAGPPLEGDDPCPGISARAAIAKAKGGGYAPNT